MTFSITPAPRLRHLNCQDCDCRSCMQDADGLSKYLADRMTYNDVDVLSKYRKYLDENNVVSENSAGWILPSAYKIENINSFLDEWNQPWEDDNPESEVAA